MKTIFKFIVRGLAVIGFAVVLVSAVGWGAFFLREKPQLPEEILLAVDLTQPVVEQEGGGPMRIVAGKQDELRLADVIAALDLASKDPRVKLLVGTFRDDTFSLAVAQEVRAGVRRFADKGKDTYAFATSFGEFGPANKAYMLATGFDHIWVQPLGLLGITGLALEMPFGRDALEKIGARADFVHREEYKSAMDSFTENDFTAANREMMESMLLDLSGQMAGAIMDARNISAPVLYRLMDEAPVTAEKAKAAGLIDAIGYADEVEQAMRASHGEDAEFVDIQDYLALRRQEKQEEDMPKNTPTVAFIHATGNILQSADGVAGGDVIAADEMAAAIDDAVEDISIEAILLRLDSPGGSAVASETIRHSLKRAQDTGLPIIVSMGTTAASGGYWISSVADVVLADPATLTGSIGVIAGKVAGTDVWDKIGVHWGRLSEAENSDLWSVSAPFTDGQRRHVDALIGDVYDAFRQRVAEGRGMNAAEVAGVAKGRVWTGRQAVENGLVDEIGGFYDAIMIAKSLTGIAEDDPIYLKTFPAPETLEQKIGRLLSKLSNIGVITEKLGILLHGMETRLAPLMGVTGDGRQAVMPVGWRF
jgi:protease-4